MGESSKTILCPWLLYFHDDDKNNGHKIFCNIAGSPRQSSSIPHLNNKTETVLASSHGWLILKNNNNDAPHDFYYHLWSPITFESIHFPPFKSKPEHRIFSVILSSPPEDDSNSNSNSNSNSMLLLFEATIPAVFVCRLSKPEWVELRYAHLNFYKPVWDDWDDFKLEIGHLHSPVSFNGNVFAIGGEYELFRVEVKLDNTIFLHKVVHLPLYSNLQHHNLVDCCGELYIVFSTKGNVYDHSIRNMVAVHVYKLNFSGMIWEKVDNIHDHAFFLSYGNAISCSAAVLSSFPALKHRIYFTMYEDGYEILYSYHVEDGTLTMCPPCSDLPTLSRPPIWVTLPTLGTNQDEQKEETLKALVFAEEGKDNEENVFRWTDLPMDLRKLISEKLPPFDYMNLRAVCRMNRKIAPPIQWRTKLAESDQSDQLHWLSPWLIYSPAGRNICNFLDPNLNERYLVKTPELFQDPIVRCCKGSWLLMSETEKSEDGLLSMFLFNPFTKATIQLPSLTVEVPYPAVRFSLTSLPYSSDRCCVVCFWNRWKKVNFLVTSPGSEQWLYLVDDTESFYAVDNAPVYMNNRFYYLSEDGKLGLFTINDRCDWSVHHVEGRPDDFQYIYLVECDGELLSVFVGFSGTWVKVFRLGGDDKIWRWEPVLDLGKHVLYLSRLSTLSKVAQVEGTENRIYFERLYRERAIFYSLNTNKFHTSNDKDSLESYDNTSEPLLCAWIEPNWCDKL